MNRLSYLSIQGFNGIDALELDFPLPDLPGDPDVFVIGGPNGIGKTKVLELCCKEWGKNNPLNALYIQQERTRERMEGWVKDFVLPFLGQIHWKYAGHNDYSRWSAGQLSIISTLAVVVGVTKDNPTLVLIDTPELHLNSEWHRPLMNDLFRLAPNNQYIIVTHSATIMDSVYRNRRILLSKD